jgi:hypothetical protein
MSRYPEVSIEDVVGNGIEFVTKVERHEENDWLNDAIASVMKWTNDEIEVNVPTVDAVKLMVNMLTGLGIDFVPVPDIYPNGANGLVAEWKVGLRELEIEVMSNGTWPIEWLKTVNKEDGSIDLDQFREGVMPYDKLEEARPLVEWVMAK